MATFRAFEQQRREGLACTRWDHMYLLYFFQNLGPRTRSWRVDAWEAVHGPSSRRSGVGVAQSQSLVCGEFGTPRCFPGRKLQQMRLSPSHVTEAAPRSVAQAYGAVPPSETPSPSAAASQRPRTFVEQFVQFLEHVWNADALAPFRALFRPSKLLSRFELEAQLMARNPPESEAPPRRGRAALRQARWRPGAQDYFELLAMLDLYMELTATERGGGDPAQAALGGEGDKYRPQTPVRDADSEEVTRWLHTLRVEDVIVGVTRALQTAGCPVWRLEFNMVTVARGLGLPGTQVAVFPSFVLVTFSRLLSMGHGGKTLCARRAPRASPPACPPAEAPPTHHPLARPPAQTSCLSRG